MRSEQLGCCVALALTLGWTHARSESDYWLVASGEDAYAFVDASTIQKGADGTIWAWVERVIEGDEVKTTGFKSDLAFVGISCQLGTISEADEIQYDNHGHVVKSFPSDPTPYSRIVPDSFGEREKEFLCADYSRWALDKRWAHLADQGQRDPVAFADSFYAFLHRPVSKPR
jgi:hypothetical protein